MLAGSKYFVDQNIMNAKFFLCNKRLNHYWLFQQVLQRYESLIRPALHPANWSEEDSKMLVDTVTRLRIGSCIPWSLVAQYVPGFTTCQLQSRWKTLNPEIIRGPFTLDEDFMLVKVHSSFISTNRP